MPPRDQSNPTAREIDEDLYILLKSETKALQPDFENALAIMSTPGHDPQTISDAIGDYILLTRRLNDALKIADINIYQAFFEHILNNLELLYKLCTPLTHSQSDVFSQWLILFLNHLASPNKQDTHRELASCLVKKNWPQDIDTHKANQFYRALQSLQDQADTNSNNNLIDFPTVYQSDNNELQSEIELPNAQSDICAYEALSINRKNAWLKVCFDTLNLLFPQTDIITIETLEGLSIDQTDKPEYASLSINNDSVPVYALSKTLELIQDIPTTYSKAIILKSTAQYYGILCETMATHTTHQAIDIEPIPSVLRNSASPIRFLTKCRDKISYIIRSEDLYSYINQFHINTIKKQTQHHC